MDWFGIVFFVAVFGALAYWMLRPRKGPVRVCTVCHHHGPTKTTTRGSSGMELVLWLCFLVPGLIYSLWRLSTRGVGCASCGSTQVVPATSPVGRKLLADLGAATAPAGPQ